MTHIIVEISKYFIIILFSIYTFSCFSVFKYRSEAVKNRIYIRQRVLLYAIQIFCYMVLYLQSENIFYLLFYLFQLLFFLLVPTLYNQLYPNSSKLLTNNMCMLSMLGLIMLSRLSVDKAIKQFVILALSLVLGFLIPIMMKKLTFLKNLTILYAILGAIALSIVFLAGSATYGAKISLSFFGITLQPAEFVKIIFVFCIAGMLSKSTSIFQIIKTSAVAALHVLLLVASKDLGGALIFFLVYLIMLFMASRQPLYLIGGLGLGSIAALVGYKLFSHVQVRVVAWRDPFSYIDKEGYQITQSLFAIGTGGWFGMGLMSGMPEKIPVVDKDFMFSAIAEEFGGIFALCLILVCASCFIMFMNIAIQIAGTFYKLVAAGLGIIYGFQIFLTIGGAIKLIPSTGVTLPLVSYGGSSILSTVIIFTIIQGLYILKQKEVAEPNGKTEKSGKTEKNEKRKASRL